MCTRCQYKLTAISLPCSAAPGWLGRGSVTGPFPERCHSASLQPLVVPPQGPPCFLSGVHHRYCFGVPAMLELRKSHCEEAVSYREREICYQTSPISLEKVTSHSHIFSITLCNTENMCFLNTHIAEIGTIFATSCH